MFQRSQGRGVISSIRPAPPAGRIRRNTLCVHAIDQPRPCGHDLCREVREMENDQGVNPMKFADKACPVVFRDPSLQQILAFEHPEAGVQLVKGRIEPGENARAAALRELQEEAGIADMAIASDLGTWHSEHNGHIWSFQLCTFTNCRRPGPIIAPTMVVTTSN